MRESIDPEDKLAVQACDDFLDELLSHEVGGEGRVPDIRYIHAFLIRTRNVGLPVEFLNKIYGTRL